MGVVQILNELHELVDDYDRTIAATGAARERALAAIINLQGASSIDQLEDEPVVENEPEPPAPGWDTDITIPAAAEPAVASVSPYFENGTVNYPGLAVVANEAVAAGRSPMLELMERFDAQRSTVNNWMTKLRRQNLIGPPPMIPVEPTAAPTPVATDSAVWTPDRAAAAIDNAA